MDDTFKKVMSTKITDKYASAVCVTQDTKDKLIALHNCSGLTFHNLLHNIVDEFVKSHKEEIQAILAKKNAEMFG